MGNIIVRIYNSSDILIYEGDYLGYTELKKHNQINSSDRISFIERSENE